MVLSQRMHISSARLASGVLGKIGLYGTAIAWHGCISV